MRQTRANAAGMQQNSGDDKASPVAQAGRMRRHLRAMGVAMAKSKKAGHRHAGPERQAQREDQKEAEQKYRGQDPLLRHRHGHSRHAGSATDDHCGNEGGGHQPKSAPAELHRPQAHGDHRQQVIPAVERMRDAGGEAVEAMAGMRVSQRGDQQQCGQEAEEAV